MGKFETRISGITEVGDYIVYDIDIRLSFQKFKFKEFQISKRFNDFIKFRKSLIDLGYSFIPQLPSRFTFFLKGKDTIIKERKDGLINFSNFILNDLELREIDEVLLFYHIPKSDINELKLNDKVIENKSEIDSAIKWMEIYKKVKSNIQNVRIRVNNSTNNLKEITSLIDSSELNLNNLKDYLNQSIELSNDEIKRRNQLLNSLSIEISEIKNMINIIKPVESIDNNFYKNSSHRTFGKPIETDETKKLNNNDFLQIQKFEIQSQDERLQELHQIVTRQKQIGIAVNEELNLQNELINELDKHIDKSTDKINIAKSKVKKFI